MLPDFQPGPISALPCARAIYRREAIGDEFTEVEYTFYGLGVLSFLS